MPKKKVDKTPQPTRDSLATCLPALTKHATAVCYNLMVEFGEIIEQLKVQPVPIDAFFSDLAAAPAEQRDRFEKHICTRLDRQVLEPLQNLYKKLRDLHQALTESDQSLIRALHRQAVMQDESNFTKMLQSFETQVYEILLINQQDEEYQAAAKKSLAAANELAEQGERLHRSLYGYSTASGEAVPGHERELSELTRQTVLELVASVNPQSTKEQLEQRRRQLERLLHACQQVFGSLANVRQNYEHTMQQLNLDQGSLILSSREWRLQMNKISAADEHFRYAGLDPFLLSDALAEFTRAAVMKQPGGDERRALEALLPKPCPGPKESQVAERAQKVIREIVDALQELEAAAAPPVTPPPASASPVTWPELALCTYAAFVRRSVRGQAYRLSGRTARKVYQSILVPAGLTHGCTELQFSEAVQEAENAGWLQHFSHPKKGDIAQNWCYQPTLKGFALAEAILLKLPSDFKNRINTLNDVLKAEAVIFRQKIRARKHST